MDGELGAYVRGEIAKASLVAMDKIWDNGFRQTTSSHQADQQRPTTSRASRSACRSRPLWTSMFKAFDASPTIDQFQRGLFGAADQDRRGPGKSAGAHLDRQALRSAEILLADQPHVGRLLVPRQPPRLGDACRRTCAPSSRRTSTRPREGARRHRQAQRQLAVEISRRKGLVFNAAGGRAVPREAAQRPGSMPSGRANTATRRGHAGEIGRQAVVASAKGTSCAHAEGSDQRRPARRSPSPPFARGIAGIRARDAGRDPGGAPRRRRDRHPVRRRASRATCCTAR